MKTQSHRFPFAFQRVIGQTPTDRGRERTCAAKVPSYQLVSAQQRASEITFTRDTWIGCAHQGLACVHTCLSPEHQHGVAYSALTLVSRRAHVATGHLHAYMPYRCGPLARRHQEPRPAAARAAAELRQSCGSTDSSRRSRRDDLIAISPRSRRDDLAATISPPSCA